MKRVLVTLVLSLIIMGIFSGTTVAEITSVKQVVLVLWHGLNWEDVRDFDLKGPVAWGFLNTRSGGGDNLVGSYLSIGAGARAVGVSGAATFLPRDSAEHVYRLHTGAEPGLYVQPNISLVHRAQTVSYRVEPGALGQVLYDGGDPPKVLGNSNGFDKIHWAALVGMDNLGRVWAGNIGDIFRVLDPRYPYGIRTDYQALADEVLQAEEKLVVVELGDPFRWDSYETVFTNQQREVSRLVMVAEAREFLTILDRNREPETVVLVVSPHPGKQLASQNYWLTPVFCVGIRDGLLLSGTTRWPGLITNMDVAPTILDLLQIDYEPFIGRPAFIQATSESKGWLEVMAQKIGFLAVYRGQILRAVVVAQILIYGLILATLILHYSLPRWAVRALQTSLLVLLSTPLSLLLWDQFRPIALGLPLVLIVIGLKAKPLPLVGMISLCTTLLISFDVLGGSWWIRYSPLGYDPIGGARFYGIGNEFMGVLVGATIMGWAVLMERYSHGSWLKVLAFLFFMGIVVIIGLPSLGTNVGGAISAVFGFGSSLFFFANKRLNLLTGALLVLAVVLVLGSFMVLDSANTTDQQSHIGQTVELFQREGFAALLLVIERKLAMNLRLMRFSIWSRALLVTLGVMAASLIWPSKFIFWLKEHHPFMAKGIAGVVIGSIFALIFNDSGVVAAATCISFGASPLLLLALELKHNFVAPQPDV
ncbi:MAG: hypothetical protein GX971_06580 [Firmicutes bacterium]|nr:hypothetical protein [Bacillota bacterium]